jgi:hypothetical protein
MRVAPTLNGGLRIDAEAPGDWDSLRSIVRDAKPAELAHRLTEATGSDTEDWEEFVQPELQTTFEGQLEIVRTTIEDAADLALEGPGPLFISKSNAQDWYGALNQARLALHARYDFAQEDPDPEKMSVKKRAAFYRNQFYSIVQDLLLDRVIKG